MFVIPIDSSTYLALLEIVMFVVAIGVTTLATEAFKFSAWSLASRGHGVPLEEFQALIHPVRWLKHRLVPRSKVLSLTIMGFLTAGVALVGNGHSSVAVADASTSAMREAFAPAGITTDLRCFLRRRASPRQTSCQTEIGKRFEREFESLIDRSSRLLTWSTGDRVTVDPTIQTPEGVKDLLWTSFHRGQGGIFAMNKAIAMTDVDDSSNGRPKEMVYEHGLPSPVLEGTFGHFNVTSNPCGFSNSILRAGHGVFFANDVGGQGTKRLYEAALPEPFGNVVAKMRYAVILQADAFFFSSASNCSYSMREAWAISYEFFLSGSECMKIISEFGVLPHVQEVSYCLMSGTGYILATDLTGEAEPIQLTILSDGVYIFTAWSGIEEKEPVTTDVLAENVESGNRNIMYAPYINSRVDSISEEGMVGLALMQASQWLAQYSMAQRQVPKSIARIEVSEAAIAIMVLLGLLAIAGWVLSNIKSDKDLVPFSALEGMQAGALDEHTYARTSGDGFVCVDGIVWGIEDNAAGNSQHLGVANKPTTRKPTIPFDAADDASTASHNSPAPP